MNGSSVEAGSQRPPTDNHGAVGRAPNGFERRLLFLMGARLALSAVSLGIAVALEAAGWPYSPAEWRGFYGTVIFAFLATIGYGLMLPRVKHVRRFAAVNIATDIAIVSALVHVSGGSDSPFAFLYVLVAVYGAVLFERPGAVVCAIASAVIYGSVLVAEQRGWVASRAISSREPATVIVGMWLVHAGAVVLVAGLASLLSAELRRTDEALKQRTSDLRRVETLHQRTVESLVSGLLTTDLQGKITSFNPEAERITGRTSEEVLGRDVEQVLPGIRELVIRAASGGRVTRSRARTSYQNSRGELRHIGAAAYVLKGSQDGIDGYVVIFQDVSEVVEMEASLRRSERLAAIGELSASIAHEIRNPLAAISGSIEMLQTRRDTVGRAEAEQLMAIVLREVDRLDHLITDFLHYAQPGPRTVQPVRLVDAVEEVRTVFAGAQPESIDFAVEIGATLAVLADAAQLNQVLWNLVLNAAQAMPEGGRLTITAEVSAPGRAQGPGSEGRRAEDVEEKAHQVEIAVADTGEGVAPEALDRIFDPFFTTKRGGSGLGLATVHRIVEEHGGSIRFESEVGSGTCVRIRLPMAEALA